MGSDALKSAQAPCLPESTERHYTVHEAAALLNVPIADLEAAMANQTLFFVHQYGRKLIAARDVDAYRTQHPVAVTAAPDAPTE